MKWIINLWKQFRTATCRHEFADREYNFIPESPLGQDGWAIDIRHCDCGWESRQIVRHSDGWNPAIGIKEPS